MNFINIKIDMNDLKEIILRYLRADTECYNIKTVQLKSLRQQITYRHTYDKIMKLKFLPAEFILYLELSQTDPDPFAIIPTYESFLQQFFANELIPKHQPRYYELISREYFLKTECVRMSIVYIRDMYENVTYGIYKNFQRTFIGPMSMGLTFVAALTMFYTTNI